MKKKKGLEGLTASTSTLPWQWEESQWRKLVNRVRAGRPLVPMVWKDDARCAFAMSFDSDHETNELRDGGKSIGRLSWGEYGARAGMPRIRRLLERYEIPATFFVPAVSALLHSEEQRGLVAEAHEIGLHGWIHELNTNLERDIELDLLRRSADTLEDVSGVRPVGMRTPSWDFSENTLSIACELGLLYDSSLMADDHCYELLMAGKPSGIVELPVEWIRDDAAYFMMDRFAALRPYASPEAVLNVFIREFDAAYEEGGLFQLTCHPHIIGYRSRIWILEELFRHAKSRSNVWYATHADIVRWVLENAQ